MKKWSILFFFLFGFIANSFGRSGQHFNFKINGTINVDSGKIYLNFYSDYVPNKNDKIIAEIKNKKFFISGYIPESQGVFISLDNGYISSDFIIDKGVQTISINIDSIREVPVVQNRTMLEEYPDYTSFHKEIKTKKELFNQKIDSLYRLYNYKLPKSIKLILDKEQKAIYNASDSILYRKESKLKNCILESC